MQFRTKVAIPKPDFEIGPCEEMLFVGSCFADNIGRRFREEKFRATVNPYGVMYNPASILHTVRRCAEAPRVALFTLGTNHVYILNETGEIVDNCAKRPQRLFTERELTVDECAGYLGEAVDVLAGRRADVKVVVTVSPIRYAKYGFHGAPWQGKLFPRIRDSQRRASRLPLLRSRHASPLGAGRRVYMGGVLRGILLACGQAVHRGVAPTERGFGA